MTPRRNDGDRNPGSHFIISVQRVFASSILMPCAIIFPSAFWTNAFLVSCFLTVSAATDSNKAACSAAISGSPPANSRNFGYSSFSMSGSAISVSSPANNALKWSSVAFNSLCASCASCTSRRRCDSATARSFYNICPARSRTSASSWRTRSSRAGIRSRYNAIFENRLDIPIRVFSNSRTYVSGNRRSF